MPIVSILEHTLFSRLGRSYSEIEFDELCFQYGLELDEITSERELVAREKGADKAKECSAENIFKVEVPANRYDLLCPEGLSRALKIFNQETQTPVFKKSKMGEPIQISVKGSAQGIRPYVVAAVLRNITLDESRLNNFIDLQEKLHQNICRKRSLVAIGAHDLDTISGPFTYEARNPSEIHFRPLNKTQEYTATELMELYSTDPHLKSYLPIIRDKERYPLITDKDGIVLSMPPIINGDHTRISVGTKNILIEATATDLQKAHVVLDTLVTMFSEYCDPPFQVEPVEVIQHDGTRQLCPRLEYRDEVVSVDYINRLLGTQFSESEVITQLNRMGLITKAVGGSQVNGDSQTVSSSPITTSTGLLSVRIPPTRHDILHACDIAEDVAIAHGYDNIPEQLPQTYCIARSQPINRLSDMLRACIAEAGFTEVLSFSLCSRDDVSSKLRHNLSTVPAVHISNPKTIDFQVVRTSLLPGILNTMNNNRGIALPLKLFEIQDVVIKDTKKDVGASNQRHICATYYNKHSGFEIIHGLLGRLMQVLSVPWKGAVAKSVDSLDDKAGTPGGCTYELKAASDPTFFEGRCADVILQPGNRRIGQLGVLHPEVLRNFELTMPCSALVLQLEIFV